MKPMTFVSLFAGIGGLDLGLERAGMKCIAQVEIDEFCRKVLTKHWPDVPKFNDVREFNRESISERPDLICGGFPCQDISTAGRRIGIDGERSGLWSEYFRIICELRPSFVVVENVAALLVRGIDRVLGNLASVGFDAQWSVLSACAFSAPHSRERLFLIAYPSEIRFDARWSEQSLRRLGEAGEARMDEWRRHGALPEFCRVGHGFPSRVDRIGALGNAVIPQVAEWIGRRIVEFHRSVPVMKAGGAPTTPVKKHGIALARSPAAVRITSASSVAVPTEGI